MASETSSSSQKGVGKCDGEATDLCTGGEDGGDRISDLPDVILGLILSSFTTKEAVRTSVLSTRWRYVWTSVPRIHIFDLSLLSKDRRSSSPEVKACFMNFVDRVLKLNSVSRLKKFHLTCCENYGPTCFRDWISTVTIRDVEGIYLEYMGWLRIELPPSIFTCRKLVILNLNKKVVLNVPPSAFLPSLKVLCLFSVQFFDDNSMNNLLAGCPVLEELDMERDYNDNAKTLHIQSSSLTSLRLETVISSDENLGIVLDAKLLQHLDLKNHVEERFDVKCLSSVVSVYLDVYQDNTLELLRKMCSTVYLNLSAYTMETLKLATLENLPMFHYLTHLVVEIINSGWPALPYLLECVPNLVTFEFSQHFSSDPDVVGFRTPNCLMLHLESISISAFFWSQDEMKMVSYFLKNAIVLRKMYLYPGNLSPHDQESNLRNELGMLPKSSAACEVEVLPYDCSAGMKYYPLLQSYRDFAADWGAE